MKPVPDPGLQAERTLLAWNRTAAAMAVNALVLLRVGFQPGAGGMLVPGALLGGVAVALLLVGQVRHRQLTAGSAQAPSARLMAATCAGAVAAGLAGVWSTSL